MRKFDPFEPPKPPGAGEKIGECSRCGAPVYGTYRWPSFESQPLFSCGCRAHAEMMRGMTNIYAPAREEKS